MGHLYSTHPWLTGLSSPLTCSVLLKVALFWLSSEHRPGVGRGGGGLGSVYRKKCLDES